MKLKETRDRMNFCICCGSIGDFYFNAAKLFEIIGVGSKLHICSNCLDSLGSAEKEYITDEPPTEMDYHGEPLANMTLLRCVNRLIGSIDINSESALLSELKEQECQTQIYSSLEATGLKGESEWEATIDKILEAIPDKQPTSRYRGALSFLPVYLNNIITENLGGRINE